MRFRLFSLAALLVALSASPAAQRDVPGDERVSTSAFVTPDFPRSAEGRALVRAGVFGRAHDPVRMLDNPALLADLADGLRVSGAFAPSVFDLDNIDGGAAAVSGGRTVQVVGQSVAVAVGVAGQVAAFQPSRTVGEPDPSTNREWAGALGVGAAYDGPVRVRAGVSGRYLRSTDYPTTLPTMGGEVETDRARAVTADLGLDVTAPVGRWLRPEPSASGSRIVLDLGVGYVVRNATLYDDPIQLERTLPPNSAPQEIGTPDVDAGVGLAALVGLDVRTRTTPLRAVSLEAFAEPREFDGFGDRYGLRLTLAEAVAVSGGRAGDLYGVGVALSVGGALRALAALDGDRQRYDRAGRFDLRYTSAHSGTVFGSSTDGRTFDSLGDVHGLVLTVR